MNLKFFVVYALSVYGCLGIDEQQSCDGQCTPTYPLHTYPKTEYYVACTRGCRLAYLARYTSDGTTNGCNQTCNEAYGSDVGAAYACNVGCGVSIDMVFGSDTAQISVINNLMDVLFVSRVLDMLSYNDESQSDTNEEWGDEVDVYLSEDWSTTNLSTADNNARWSVYSVVWFFDSVPSHVTTSTQVDTSEDSDGYYLVYYKHWSLTETGFVSQLFCYVTLFLFMVALLKCCHILVHDGSDDGSEGLSIKADNGYDTGKDDIDDDDDAEMMALLEKKRQQYMSGNVQKPPHTERVLVSMSSFLPVQNTKLYNGGKVEGILTIV